MSISYEEYNRRLEALANETTEDIIESVAVPSVNFLLANIKNRIMVDGKDSDGNSLKLYSTKPAYFTKDDFVKPSSFVAKGKNPGRNVQNRKSMYIQDGYKGLRDVQGKPTDIKDITYSGDMMRSYVQGRKDNSLVIGFNSNAESEKRKHNEKREGVKIFSATDEEIQDYNKEFTQAYKELITDKLLK